MTWEHHLVSCLFLFAVGAAAGSFANVCLHRIPLGLNVLRPRSCCPGCLTPIAARDNIPIVGWLLLRGRCRRCGSSISAMYPLIEMLFGLFLVAGYLTELICSAGDPLDRGLPVLASRILGYLAVLASVVLLYAFRGTRDTRGTSSPGCDGLRAAPREIP